MLYSQSVFTHLSANYEKMQILDAVQNMPTAHLGGILMQ